MFEKNRAGTRLTNNGARLVDAPLSLGHSGLAVLGINDLATPTEREEQTGFANVIKGLASRF